MTDANASLDIAVRLKNSDQVKATLRGIQNETKKASASSASYAMAEASEKKKILRGATIAEMVAKKRAEMAKREIEKSSAKEREAAYQAETRRVMGALKRELVEKVRTATTGMRFQKRMDETAAKSRIYNIKRVELAETKSTDFITRRILEAKRKRAVAGAVGGGDRSTNAPLASGASDTLKALRWSLVAGGIGAAWQVGRRMTAQSLTPNPKDMGFTENMHQLSGKVGGERQQKLQNEMIDNAIGMGATAPLHEQSKAINDMVDKYGEAALGAVEGNIAMLNRGVELTGKSFATILEEHIKVAKAAGVDQKNFGKLSSLLTSTDYTPKLAGVSTRIAGMGGAGGAIPTFAEKSGQGGLSLIKDVRQIMEALIEDGATPDEAAAYTKKIIKGVSSDGKIDPTQGLMSAVEEAARQGLLPKGAHRKLFGNRARDGSLRAMPRGIGDVEGRYAGTQNAFRTAKQNRVAVEAGGLDNRGNLWDMSTREQEQKVANKFGWIPRLKSRHEFLFGAAEGGISAAKTLGSMVIGGGAYPILKWMANRGMFGTALPGAVASAGSRVGSLATRVSQFVSGGGIGSAAKSAVGAIAPKAGIGALMLMPGDSAKKRPGPWPFGPLTEDAVDARFGGNLTVPRPASGSFGPFRVDYGPTRGGDLATKMGELVAALDRNTREIGQIMDGIN